MASATGTLGAALAALFDPSILSSAATASSGTANLAEAASVLGPLQALTDLEKDAGL